MNQRKATYQRPKQKFTLVQPGVWGYSTSTPGRWRDGNGDQTDERDNRGLAEAEEVRQ